MGHPRVTEAVLGTQFLRDTHPRARAPKSLAPLWVSSPPLFSLHRSSKASVAKRVRLSSRLQQGCSRELARLCAPWPPQKEQR